MADVASDQARREARRKRILENSENRLQRITGKYKEKSSEGKHILPVYFITSLIYYFH